ncbi:hypothetical protein L7F22_067014 [Adiantum nelumboides]|nr:hypothetical protein [Adiantum nelumboides]
MSKNMQEEERLIDFGKLDLQNDVVSPDATWAIDFLTCKLQEAMANPALQGVLHTQLQERHLTVLALEENSPYKSQHEASKRDINELKPHNSTSTTSPSQHTSIVHSDPAASSSHGHTRSLREIYKATSFSAILTNEIILEHPQGPLEDALPLSVVDALASSESKEWHAAILDELQALKAANTWELVPPPEHHNIISCKWLLKKKYHPDGSVDRYKARLVTCGFTQQQGVDYFDTYLPVLGMIAFWLLIALTAKCNLLLHHVDIVTAFLHGMLQELIYMLQPPHFEDPHHPEYVCKLNKPIYDLKQSAREWYIRMHHYLIKCGWEHLMADYNIYIWQTAKGMAILGLFVDDIPLLGTSKYMLLQAIDCISQEFPVTDKGPMTYFLGIEVIQDPAGKFIQLSQSKYIEELLLFYGMSALAPKLTPLPVIAERLSAEEIARLKETFKMMDADDSGAITFEKLKVSLERLGSGLMDNEVMDAVDIDKSGSIDYQEFITATLNLNKIEREVCLWYLHILTRMAVAS